jgi:hypothetical protein
MKKGDVHTFVPDYTEYPQNDTPQNKSLGLLAASGGS